MIKLWNQTMPHRCVEDAFEPYLTPYDCDAAKTAIVVCPGGAYCGRADYEGNDVGAWLNTIGIAAFVLEYRVAPSKAPAQPSDAQRAMRLARKLCMERGIERLGIMGFSAGGHLAATLSVHYATACVDVSSSSGVSIMLLRICRKSASSRRRISMRSSSISARTSSVSMQNESLETSGLILEYSCQCSSQISGRKAVSKRRSFGIISSKLVWLRR